MNTLLCCCFSFKQKLQKFRQLDDKIINILNSEITTESFHSQQDPGKKCVELNNEVNEYYKLRENAIRKCVSYAKDEIVGLRETNAVESTNKFLLREKIFNLRQFEDELKIEEIIKSRSLKVSL